MDISNSDIDPSKYTVMIVDDIPVNTRLLQKILERESFNLNIFNNSIQAFEALQTVKPDVLLLDIMMPGLDGLGFLQKMRADSAFDQTRVIMVTAVSESDEITKANALGANDYVTKPINSKRLVSCIYNQIRQIEK
ncbi:MAG: response regulator [Bacteroidaceae bacterium]|nr:response regulator [Bacteroidaceae bacterium]